ncbi:MAG: phosphate/phosphite/phosphonate ABC transporter substrate-binding protein [Gammaproteobacteria bacterium]|nr:phosphate/phosphite/phosphonate ABC transporter substrate-binding protein [Gammaproteobacteria bacterium]
MKILVILSLLISAFTVSAKEELVFARAPQLAARITSQQWTPFVQKLSESTGVAISLRVYTERNDFERDIRHGAVDFYYGNPGYGVVGHIRHGYIPIIRSGRKLLEGIVVVKKDSGITDIRQLAGKTIAFPDKNAFAASLYIQSIIKSDFGISYNPVYTASHDNTYRAVLIGTASAGGGIKRTLESEQVRLRDQLKTIYVTPGMKSHPIMVHPGVPEKIRRTIQNAILNMEKSDNGKQLLKTIKLQKPVVADYNRDYRKIEPLVRNMYKDLID